MAGNEGDKRKEKGSELLGYGSFHGWGAHGGDGYLQVLICPLVGAGKSISKNGCTAFGKKEHRKRMAPQEDKSPYGSTVP
jgi:hypothetical protein